MTEVRCGISTPAKQGHTEIIDMLEVSRGAVAGTGYDYFVDNFFSVDTNCRSDKT